MHMNTHIHVYTCNTCTHAHTFCGDEHSSYLPITYIYQLLTFAIFVLLLFSLSPPASFKKINSLKAICKHHNTSLQITFNDTVELATVNYVWLQSEILQWSWNLREVSLTKGAFDSLMVKKKKRLKSFAATRQLQEGNTVLRCAGWKHPWSRRPRRGGLFSPRVTCFWTTFLGPINREGCWMFLFLNVICNKESIGTGSSRIVFS